MVLFDKTPHYYNDERQVLEAIYKALPKGFATSASDFLVADHLHKLLDVIESALSDLMGRGAFLHNFAAKGLDEPLPVAARSKLIGVVFGNDSPESIDTREYYQFRWKATCLVLYQHCGSVGEADAFFKEFWKRYAAYIAQHPQADVPPPQAVAAAAQSAPAPARPTIPVPVQRVHQPAVQPQPSPSKGPSMPDLTTFVNVEIPQLLERGIERNSLGPVEPAVKQTMLESMRSSFKRIYTRHLGENRSEAAALQGAIAEFREMHGG